MIDFDPNKTAERFFLLGTDYAEKNGKAERLEYRRHIVLAELANQSNEGSEASKERFARSHPTYAKHIEEMVAARTEANIAKARWDADRARVDLLRTKAATERAVNKESA